MITTVAELVEELLKYDQAARIGVPCLGCGNSFGHIVVDADIEGDYSTVVVKHAHDD